MGLVWVCLGGSDRPECVLCRARRDAGRAGGGGARVRGLRLSGGHRRRLAAAQRHVRAAFPPEERAGQNIPTGM